MLLFFREEIYHPIASKNLDVKNRKVKKKKIEKSGTVLVVT